MRRSSCSFSHLVKHNSFTKSGYMYTAIRVTASSLINPLCRHDDGHNFDLWPITIHWWDLLNCYPLGHILCQFVINRENMDKLQISFTWRRLTSAGSSQEAHTDCHCNGEWVTHCISKCRYKTKIHKTSTWYMLVLENGPRFFISLILYILFSNIDLQQSFWHIYI